MTVDLVVKASYYLSRYYLYLVSKIKIKENALIKISKIVVDY